VGGQQQRQQCARCRPAGGRAPRPRRRRSSPGWASSVSGAVMSKTLSAGTTSQAPLPWRPRCRAWPRSAPARLP
jgi:hypothetical protein